VGQGSLSVEETAAKFFFQLLDSSGQRGLRDIADFGRPREIEGVSDC
jgi:hypothetical protein